ncbi:MAG: hypothetical protein K2Q01_00170, partial [Rickettsiales bacterium]|nr:hypothetical protein [Rickettsiales bacterium]
MKWLYQEFDTASAYQAAKKEAEALTAKFLQLRKEMRSIHPAEPQSIYKFTSVPERCQDYNFVKKLHEYTTEEKLPDSENHANAPALAAKLKENFAGLKPGYGTFQYIAEAPELVVQNIFMELIGERELRRKVRSRPFGTLEEELEKERDKSKWQIRHMQQGIHDAGYKEFDGER